MYTIIYNNIGFFAAGRRRPILERRCLLRLPVGGVGGDPGLDHRDEFWRSAKTARAALSGKATSVCNGSVSVKERERC